MPDLEILEPTSIEDATKALVQYEEDAKVLGGGTALVLMYRQGLINPRVLISLARIPDLDFILDETGTGLRLGALTTHYAVETSQLVREKFPVVADVFHKVANIRVRNQATVGGVLAEADYASDPPTVLVALEAEVRIIGSAGERAVKAEEFIRGFYQTALKPDEVISEIIIPEMRENAEAAYLKYVSRSSEDRPCVGVAALVEHRGSICDELRVVVGAVAGKPQRFRHIEALARGEKLTDSLRREIARRYAEEIEPLSDMRGSSWYRKQVIEVLVRRAIEQTGAVNDR